MGGEARGAAGVRVARPAPRSSAWPSGVHARVETVEAALSRFRPGSELNALNADPRRAVPVSPLLRRTVAAANWAARAQRRARRRDPARRARAPRLRGVLGRDPPRRHRGGARRRAAAAAGGPGRAGTASAARRSTRRVASRGRPACGWTPAASRRAWPPTSPPPRSPRASATRSRAAATSPSAAASRGRSRCAAPAATPRSTGCACGPAAWRPRASPRGSGRRPDGSYAHHVLDPATGRPAWTGLVAATAVAGSALEAEVLAKTALLSGPLAARRLLRRRGGVLQHDDGRVEVVPAPAVVRLPRPVAA